MTAKAKAKSKAKATKATRKKKAVAVALPPAPDLDTKWHDQFLQLLLHSSSVTTAALGAGINRATAYRHRDALPEFAAQWDEAKESSIELLEAEAWNRARKKSDLLIMFLLKANKPEKYREVSRHEHGGINGEAIKHEVTKFEQAAQKIYGDNEE